MDVLENMRWPGEGAQATASNRLTNVFDTSSTLSKYSE